VRPVAVQPDVVGTEGETARQVERVSAVAISELRVG